MSYGGRIWPVLSRRRTAPRDVAHVQADVFVVGARQGGGAKVVAQIGHAKVDTTMNVYAQVLDGAARPPPIASDPSCSELYQNRKTARS